MLGHDGRFNAERCWTNIDSAKSEGSSTKERAWVGQFPSVGYTGAGEAMAGVATVSPQDQDGLHRRALDSAAALNVGWLGFCSRWPILVTAQLALVAGWVLVSLALAGLFLPAMASGQAQGGWGTDIVSLIMLGCLLGPMLVLGLAVWTGAATSSWKAVTRRGPGVASREG